MTRNEPGGSFPEADIQWTDGVPRCRRFDDVYYSPENGLAESRHVFVEGNRLLQRWREQAPARFTIFETGFGTGLNFLCTVELWLAAAAPGSVLHFVSVEKYPLQTAELSRALQSWPELGCVAAELLAHYPPTVAGVHRLWLFDQRVCLTLVFDDALVGLSQLLWSDHPRFRHAGPVADAWFLDGFAPAKNPDLWCPELLQRMADFSHGKTTLATFTVARAVREGLATAGFALEKTPGFGRKREMLRGRFQAPAPPFPEAAEYRSPKVLRNSVLEVPWHLNRQSPAGDRSVAIIGAGIAGCATAAALRKRGFEVTLYDRHGAPGREASGNPQGILYPKLSTVDSPLALFGRHALCFGRHFYRDYWKAGLPGEQCGVLVLPEDAREMAQFELIAERYRGTGSWLRPLSGDQVSTVAGVALAAQAGLFFPDFGWISPRHACEWLASGVEFATADVHSLAPAPGTGEWRLLDDSDREIARARHLVIANSYLAAKFDPCGNLPLRPVRGQITALPTTSASTGLKTVVCGAGYMAPATDGRHTLGATYGIDDPSTELRRQDHHENLATLTRTDPGLAALLSPSDAALPALAGRAAVRCTTPDYLPVVGPVANEEEMMHRFADLGRNARADIPVAGSYHPGLWINVGHGSRGFTYAPLAAELLAGQINGEVWPLPRQLAVAVHPARFIIRQVKRNLHRES